MTPNAGKQERLAREGRLPGTVLSLRRHTAHGTIINAAYLVSLNLVIVVKGLVGAAFLSPAEYGVWGLLNLALLSVAWLRDVGVNDAYIQQSEADQEREFARAFTLSVTFMAACWVLMLLLIGAFSLAYELPQLLAPGALLSTVLLAAGMHFPAWAFYRRMDFVKQRLVQGVEPLVGAILTAALLIAGLDYWSLVIGATAGAWLAAVVALSVSPYRLRIDLDRSTLKRYVSFSWPVASGVAVTVAMVQITYFLGERHLGLAGIGAIALGAALTSFTDKANSIVTQTLYPAICAVQDRIDLLYESFVKSNRLTLMWGMPFGIGLALFAGDLVDYVIGDKWDPAVPYFAAVAVATAINHIGFNWTAFYRARGHTRPLAAASLAGLFLFLAIPVPLLIAEGLEAFGFGMIGLAVVNLAVRTYFMVRLFPSFEIARHALRAIAPVIAPTALVLGARVLEPASRTPATAAIELLSFVLATIACTWLFERDLLREIWGYVRRSGPAARAESA